MAEWEMAHREYHGHYYCWIGWLLLAFVGNERLRKQAWRRRPPARTKPRNSHWRLSSNQNDTCAFQLNHPKKIWGQCLFMFTTYWYIHPVCCGNKMTESSHWQSLGFSLLCIKKPFSDSLRALFSIWNEFHKGNLYITAQIGLISAEQAPINRNGLTDASKTWSQGLYTQGQWG